MISVTANGNIWLSSFLNCPLEFLLSHEEVENLIYYFAGTIHFYGRYAQLIAIVAAMTNQDLFSPIFIAFAAEFAGLRNVIVQATVFF